MKSRIITITLVLSILLLNSLSVSISSNKNHLSNYYRPINDGCILPCDSQTAEPLIVQMNTVYLKEIMYQVVFNYPDAFISVNYTLKNDNLSELQLDVLFPFERDQDVKITTLTVDDTTKEYEWNDEINISLSDHKITVSTIQMNLAFDSMEEKLVCIEYSLKYGILEHDMGRIYYGLVYCLETSNFWNTSIDSVLFEAWVPKKYAEVSSFIFSQVSIPQSREEGGFSVYWFEKEIWFPTGNLLMEYVLDQRHTSWFFYPMLAIGFLVLFVITVSGLIIFYKKIKNLK
ncbi:MAG: hypothetical protein ACW97X_11545 [Candidatus Hodarchaeales archaeon]